MFMCRTLSGRNCYSRPLENNSPTTWPLVGLCLVSFWSVKWWLSLFQETPVHPPSHVKYYVPLKYPIVVWFHGLHISFH